MASLSRMGRGEGCAWPPYESVVPPRRSAVYVKGLQPKALPGGQSFVPRDGPPCPKPPPLEAAAGPPIPGPCRTAPTRSAGSTARPGPAARGGRPGTRWRRPGPRSAASRWRGGSTGPSARPASRGRAARRASRGPRAPARLPARLSRPGRRPGAVGRPGRRATTATPRPSPPPRPPGRRSAGRLRPRPVVLETLTSCA